MVAATKSKTVRMQQELGRHLLSLDINPRPTSKGPRSSGYPLRFEVSTRNVHLIGSGDPGSSQMLLRHQRLHDGVKGCRSITMCR